MPGFTCCVPGCYNNSHRDRELRFYTFPKDGEQREIWLRNISRAGVSGCFSTFQPTTGHRVCSIHFPGGRKTYSIRVPTLFPLRGVNETRGRRAKAKKSGPTREMMPFIMSSWTSASKPVDLTLNNEADTLEGLAPHSTSELSALGALDHPYSMGMGITCSELLKKLNEQRDIMALMEVKMKEMKSTIRQLKVTEAKLKEEVQERDRMLCSSSPSTSSSITLCY